VSSDSLTAKQWLAAIVGPSEDAVVGESLIKR
jgi:hypothetical protein